VFSLPDKFTKEKRSEIMAKIRSKGTKIELDMKAELDKNQIPYEYQPKIFGSPDFLIMQDIAIFCDSSFWHGRNWSKLKKQLSKGYWYGHIKKNRLRDDIVNAELRKQGYFVLRFWDTQIEKQMGRCITRIEKTIQAVQKERRNTTCKGKQ
jgi:DNA mismatch endonuclease (patch repair protein)